MTAFHAFKCVSYSTGISWPPVLDFATKSLSRSIIIQTLLWQFRTHNGFVFTDKMFDPANHVVGLIIYHYGRYFPFYVKQYH